MEATKLSFSISSKPSSRPNNTGKSQPPEGGSAAAADEPQPQFVTVFDPSKPSDNPARRVIPPIPNSDTLHAYKKTKTLSLPLPSDDPTAESDTHFVLDTSSADPAAAAIPYGLTLRSTTENLDSKVNATHRPEPVEQSMLRRYHNDMKILPDDRGLDEFDDVPVDGYAAAILAGYGWSEGKGIGKNNKGDTKVVQYERRQGNEGLGYKAGPDDPKVSKRRGRAQRDKLAAAEKTVRVVSGRHAGLKGRILERRGSSELILKLLENGEEVRVGEDMVAELGSREEERSLKKLKDLETHQRDEKRDERRSRDCRREEDERRSRDCRREEDERRSRDSRRERKSSREEQAKAAEKSTGIGGWLRSHIRVRIISKDFRGGKLYRKKGKVLDVVGPKTCDIEMDESGEFLQGVDQEILETALPKHGGSVLVLYGKHKGVYGSLVERDMEEETGVIRDAESHALINVRLDQIAEYVGDPSYLDY